MRHYCIVRCNRICNSGAILVQQTISWASKIALSSRLLLLFLHNTRKKKLSFNESSRIFFYWRQTNIVRVHSFIFVRSSVELIRVFLPNLIHSVVCHVLRDICHFSQIHSQLDVRKIRVFSTNSNKITEKGKFSSHVSVIALFFTSLKALKCSFFKQIWTNISTSSGNVPYEYHTTMTSKVYFHY